MVGNYRLYLASTATNISQIDGGGIQLGTSTFAQTIFYSTVSNRWDFANAGIHTQNLYATNGTFDGQINANGTVNLNTQYFVIDYPNAALQVDNNVNSYAPVSYTHLTLPTIYSV